MPLNPSKVKDQVSLLSSANIDKIVRVYEGVFSPADAVINANLSASGTDVYVYRVAHGLGRPVFPELIWSVDGITYLDGGSNSSTGEVSLAFSDSTYVYMFSPSIGLPYPGNVYYKFLCSWIDSYDTSNPSIESIMYRDKPYSLDSRLNYQKIYVQDVTTFATSASKTILHPLGYIPNAKVFFEAFPGEVWQLNAGGPTNPFLWDVTLQVEGYLDIYSDRIELSALFGGSSVSSRFWYRIYYDA